MATRSANLSELFRKPAEDLLFFQFENIQKLEGHHGEVWALAVSHHGKFVVTGSHDKSIRVWEKLDEPVSANATRTSPQILIDHFSSSWKKNTSASWKSCTNQEWLTL